MRRKTILLWFLRRIRSFLKRLQFMENGVISQSARSKEFFSDKKKFGVIERFVDG